MAWTPEELAAAYDSANGGGVSNARWSPEDLSAAYDQHNYNTGNAVAGQLLQGGTFGFGDEIEANLRGAERSVGNTIAGLLGSERYDPNLSFSGERDKRLAEVRAQNKGFEADHPYASIGLQVAGGLLPALAAPEGTLIKALYAPKAEGIGSAIRQGAFQGGLFGLGAGEGGLEDRLSNAGKGAAIGGAAGGLISGALSGVGALAKSDPARKLADALSDERGSISTKPREGLSEAEALVFKRLLGTKDDALTSALASQHEAVAEGAPQFISESFGMSGKRPNAAKLTRLMKYVAGYEPSMDDAIQAIGQRADDAGDRVSGILDTVAPLEEGANARAVERGGNIIDDLIRDRSRQARPAYDAIREAHAEIAPTALMKRAIKNKRVSEAVEFVKREIPEFETKGETSFDVLNEARRYLYGAAEKARREGDTYIAGLYSDARKNLTHAMDDAIGDAYPSARKLFEGKSEELAKFTEGPLGALADLADGRVNQAGARIMKMRPAEISTLSQQIGDRDVLKSVLRSHFQDVADNTTEGFNVVKKMIGTPRMKDRIRAALGESDETEKFISSLQREDTFSRFRNVYEQRSDTAANLAEANEFSKAANFFRGATDAATAPISYGKRQIDKLIEALSMKGNAKLARELAAIGFDPQRGLETLEKVVPRLKKANRYYGNVDWWTDLGRTGGNAGAGRIGGLLSDE